MASIYELLIGGLGGGQSAQPTTTVPINTVLTTSGLGGGQQVPFPHVWQQHGQYGAWQQEQLSNEAQRLRDEAIRMELLHRMQNQRQALPGALQPLVAKKPKMTFVWGEFDD